MTLCTTPVPILPTSNDYFSDRLLEQINSHISTLLGIDFLKELKDAALKTSAWARFWKDTAFPSPIGDDAGQVYGGTKRLFELRHIYAHEVPHEECDAAEIYDAFEAARVFLIASDLDLMQLLYPGGPMTASQLKKIAFDEYYEAGRELLSVYDDAISTLDDDKRALLGQSQIEWGSCITAFAGLLPTLNLRPIWPVNSYEHLTRLTRERSFFLYLLKENQVMNVTKA